MKITIHTPQEMHELGKKLAQDHKIITIEGDLGAGKTTLAKGFAEGLHINPQEIQSPTYTYINSHQGKFLHADFWRIETFEEIIAKGIHEELLNHEYIFIERPKYIEKLGFKQRTHIHIKKITETTREIQITSH